MSTDWEQLYREGTKPWDKGAAAPPLLDWIEKHPDTLAGRILVPGCGLGHDVRILAEKLANAEVTGIDISATALDEARQLPVPENVTFCQWDLFELPEFVTGTFDWIWEHTCFCAIDPEQRDHYVEAVSQALHSGGKLLGVFYLDPYDEEHQPGEGPPHGCSVEELIERFTGSGHFELFDRYSPEISYPGREGRELILGLTKSG